MAKPKPFTKFIAGKLHFLKKKKAHICFTRASQASLLSFTLKSGMFHYSPSANNPRLSCLLITNCFCNNYGVPQAIDLAGKSSLHHNVQKFVFPWKLHKGAESMQPSRL